MAPLRASCGAEKAGGLGRSCRDCYGSHWCKGLKDEKEGTLAGFLHESTRSEYTL